MTDIPQEFLTIKIEYKDTIPLSEFKEALEGWENQYNKYLSQTNNAENNERLLIKKIKEGSIEIILVNSILPLLAEYNNIFTFFQSIKTIIDWFRTKKGNKPKIDADDIANIQKITKPIKRDDTKLNISINGDNNKVVIIDKVSAQIIKENTTDALLQLQDTVEPREISTDLTNVLLKLKQVDNSENNNKFTKGMILDISKKAYPLFFSAPEIKSRIIQGLNNPLRIVYLVNVKVNKENDKIKAYTVLDILDENVDDSDETMEASLFTE